MPILVTGGTGLLGVNLVRQLVGDGQRVRLLVRSNPNRLGLESDLIEFIRGDITDEASVLRAMQGCEEVYHVAAWVQVSSWGMNDAWRINVDGTRHICSAALKLGVRRLVHTSSIAALATGSLDRPVDESTPWNLSGLHVPYYVTKRAAEDVVREYVDKGLDAVIVNPGYLIGPWDIKPSAGRMLIQLAAGRVRVAPAHGGINFADVREAAAGHIQAMQRGRTGERYFLGGENLSFRSFLTRAAAIADVAPPRIGLPFAALYPFAVAGSVLGKWMPTAFRDTNLGTLRSGFLEHYATSRKACTELGYQEVPIDRAIADALDWFADNGYLPARTTTYQHRLPN